jgi:hypothetical protein
MQVVLVSVFVVSFAAPVELASFPQPEIPAMLMDMNKKRTIVLFIASLLG